MGTDQKGFGETRFLCPFSFRVVRVIRDGNPLKVRDDDSDRSRMARMGTDQKGFVNPIPLPVQFP